MARDEQDREDLLAEATALVERASLGLPGQSEETVVGFRRDGGLALYLAADRVYQFNSSGQLRRAFVRNLLYKAQAGELVSLRRERSDVAVQLVSRPLDDAERSSFLLEMRSAISSLSQSLGAENYTLLGEVPASGQVLPRVRDWLDAHADRFTIARSPRSA